MAVVATQGASYCRRCCRYLLQPLLLLLPPLTHLHSLLHSSLLLLLLHCRYCRCHCCRRCHCCCCCHSCHCCCCCCCRCCCCVRYLVETPGGHVCGFRTTNSSVSCICSRRFHGMSAYTSVNMAVRGGLATCAAASRASRTYRGTGQGSGFRHGLGPTRCIDSVAAHSLPDLHGPAYWGLGLVSRV